MERTRQLQDVIDLQAVINHLKEELRTLRAALDATEVGRTLQRQGEEFSRLLAVSKLIVSELDLAKVHELVAARAREIVGAETVLVPMLNEGRDQYTYVAAAGVDADAVRGTTFGSQVGMCGWVLRHQRSLLFGETSTQWMAEATPWEAGQQSAVLVPLIGRKGIIGGLSALGKEGGGCFTQHDLDLLTMFANQVSIAIENARLFQEVTREIEERRQAEKALLESQSILRQILDTMPHSVFWKDRESVYRGCNNVFARAVGLGVPEAVAGKTDFDLPWPTEEAEAYRRDDREVIATDLPKLHMVEPLQQADGTRLWIDTSKVPLHDHEGNVIGVLGVYEDITAAREAHEKLEEERLRSQKLEAVGTLAGGIAHDFNNLLQGVFGYISLAKLHGDDRERSLAALDEAEKALRMSVNLTNQLLTFSKGGKPAKRAIELRPVVENAAKFTLSGSRATCRVVADPDLWPVDADEGQIYQVIQNVVLNADQAMPDGGQVEIALRNVRVPDQPAPRGLKEGSYVRVDVRDTGTGIPEKYLSRIFDPYFTTKEHGSGLGLATSYSIVRNHDGAIEVASTPGVETTFSLYLPATLAPATAEPPRLPVTAVGPKGHVLVMDDEPVIRNVATALLKRIGHRVEVAAHGQEAIDRFQAARKAGDPFDVVILDLTIRGGMGGAETVRKLREIDPAVTAVVSSGYSDDAGSAAWAEQGFKAFLKKPYDLNDLRAVLAGLLRE